MPVLGPVGSPAVGASERVASRFSSVRSFFFVLRFSLARRTPDRTSSRPMMKISRAAAPSRNTTRVGMVTFPKSTALSSVPLASTATSDPAETRMRIRPSTSMGLPSGGSVQFLPAAPDG